ncbi:hypothetical protein PQX77_002450 [Marasmius sp. AFHP31]|nr:hypothetical protein PQX77_002450 [Marasmius sp. AFHP31]
MSAQRAVVRTIVLQPLYWKEDDGKIQDATRGRHSGSVQLLAPSSAHLNVHSFSSPGHQKSIDPTPSNKEVQNSYGLAALYHQNTQKPPLVPFLDMSPIPDRSSVVTTTRTSYITQRNTRMHMKIGTLGSKRQEEQLGDVPRHNSAVLQGKNERLDGGVKTPSLTLSTAHFFLISLPFRPNYLVQLVPQALTSHKEFVVGFVADGNQSFSPFDSLATNLSYPSRLALRHLVSPLNLVLVVTPCAGFCQHLEPDEAVQMTASKPYDRRGEELNGIPGIPNPCTYLHLRRTLQFEGSPSPSPTYNHSMVVITGMHVLRDLDLLDAIHHGDRTYPHPTSPPSFIDSSVCGRVDWCFELSENSSRTPLHSNGSRTASSYQLDPHELDFFLVTFILPLVLRPGNLNQGLPSALDTFSSGLSSQTAISDTRSPIDQPCHRSNVHFPRVAHFSSPFTRPKLDHREGDLSSNIATNSQEECLVSNPRVLNVSPTTTHLFIHTSKMLTWAFSMVLLLGIWKLPSSKWSLYINDGSILDTQISSQLGFLDLFNLFHHVSPLVEHSSTLKTFFTLYANHQRDSITREATKTARATCRHDLPPTILLLLTLSYLSFRDSQRFIPVDYGGQLDNDPVNKGIPCSSKSLSAPLTYSQCARNYTRALNGLPTQDSSPFPPFCTRITQFDAARTLQTFTFKSTEWTFSNANSTGIPKPRQPKEPQRTTENIALLVCSGPSTSGSFNGPNPSPILQILYSFPYPLQLRLLPKSFLVIHLHPHNGLDLNMTHTVPTGVLKNDLYQSLRVHLTYTVLSPYPVKSDFQNHHLNPPISFRCVQQTNERRGHDQIAVKYRIWLITASTPIQFYINSSLHVPLTLLELNQYERNKENHNGLPHIQQANNPIPLDRQHPTPCKVAGIVFDSRQYDSPPTLFLPAVRPCSSYQELRRLEAKITLVSSASLYGRLHQRPRLDKAVTTTTNHQSDTWEEGIEHDVPGTPNLPNHPHLTRLCPCAMHITFGWNLSCTSSRSFSPSANQSVLAGSQFADCLERLRLSSKEPMLTAGGQGYESNRRSANDLPNRNLDPPKTTGAASTVKQPRFSRSAIHGYQLSYVPYGNARSTKQASFPTESRQGDLSRRPSSSSSLTASTLIAPISVQPSSFHLSLDSITSADFIKPVVSRFDYKTDPSPVAFQYDHPSECRLQAGTDEIRAVCGLLIVAYRRIGQPVPSSLGAAGIQSIQITENMGKVTINAPSLLQSPVPLASDPSNKPLTTFANQCGSCSPTTKRNHGLLMIEVGNQEGKAYVMKAQTLCIVIEVDFVGSHATYNGNQLLISVFTTSSLLHSTPSAPRSQLLIPRSCSCPRNGLLPEYHWLFATWVTFWGNPKGVRMVAESVDNRLDFRGRRKGKRELPHPSPMALLEYGD